MTVAARVQASVDAFRTTKSGLATSVERHPISFAVDAGDCTRVWSDRRTFPSNGADDINLANYVQNSVKLLFVRNLSTTSTMGLTAAPSAGQFRLFLADAASWNFSPMLNAGSLSLRGYPILPGGVFMVSCPNTSGLSIAVGGATLRLGGTAGQSYEIYVLGD